MLIQPYSLIQPIACFFVAWTARSDLFICAKYLFVEANHLRVPVMPRMLAAATLSGCNNCRSRASRPDTNRSWG